MSPSHLCLPNTPPLTFFFLSPFPFDPGSSPHPPCLSKHDSPRNTAPRVSKLGEFSGQWIFPFSPANPASPRLTQVLLHFLLSNTPSSHRHEFKCQRFSEVSSPGEYPAAMQHGESSCRGLEPPSLGALLCLAFVIQVALVFTGGRSPLTASAEARCGTPSDSDASPASSVPRLAAPRRQCGKQGREEAGTRPWAGVSNHHSDPWRLPST